MYLKILSNFLPSNVGFNLIFISDDYMQKLNNQFRNINEKTDVLSFKSSEVDSLGDCFVAIDYVKNLALLVKKKPINELIYIIIHGFYHLLGYDHQNDFAESIMNDLTNKLYCEVFMFEKLYKSAKDMRNNAYAPYSKFFVSTAIMLKTGEIITGVNVENSSYGLSMCAERNAMYSLISQGYRTQDIQAILVLGDTKDFISPCGACRQVLYELLPNDAKIYLTNLKGDCKTVFKDELLPFAFDLNK